MTNAYFLSLDDEEALNSIMKDLAALGRCYTQHNSHKPKNRTLLYKQVHMASNCTSLKVVVHFEIYLQSTDINLWPPTLSLIGVCKKVCSFFRDWEEYLRSNP